MHVCDIVMYRHFLNQGSPGELEFLHFVQVIETLILPWSSSP
jgi:hypothetical protein